MKREKITVYNAWRGICALFILFSHMSFVSGSDNPFWHGFHRTVMSQGSICCSFFFICSGFFLNYTWKQEQSFGQYIKGKLKRIYPLALLVFVMALGVNLLLNDQSGEVETAAVGSAPWLFNVAANLFLFKAFIPFESVFYSFHGPSWYISVLFFFYLFAYPFLHGLYGKDRKKWRKLIAYVCLGAYAAELIVCIVVRMQSYTHLWLCYVNPWFRIFGEGFAGILLCEYMPEIQERLKKIPVTALELCGVLLFLAGILLRNVVHLRIYPAWLQILFMGSILPAFRSGKGKCSEILNKKPFLFLGEISFELYMTHAFVYEGLPIASGFVSKAMKRFLLRNPGTRFVITLILCILFAWVVHLFMNWLNKKVVSKI